MDETNAIIKSVRVVTSEGYLTVCIELEHSRGLQEFGNFVLYRPQSHLGHNKNSCAGYFIWRVMEIVDVTDLSRIVGKTIRIRSYDGLIYSIGHIIKDMWFYPRLELDENYNG